MRTSRSGLDMNSSLLRLEFPVGELGKNSRLENPPGGGQRPAASSERDSCRKDADRLS